MAQIVLFHHALGLTDGVRALAEQIAGGGHTVHTPDLYDGRTFATVDEGVAHAQHLGFEEITSAAFLDNPASLGVSRKVGYVETGVTRVRRREGELARTQGLLLTPETFVRDDVRLEVTGAEAVRELIGLDAR